MGEFFVELSEKAIDLLTRSRKEGEKGERKERKEEEEGGQRKEEGGRRKQLVERIEE